MEGDKCLSSPGKQGYEQGLASLLSNSFESSIGKWSLWIVSRQSKVALLTKSAFEAQWPKSFA